MFYIRNNINPSKYNYCTVTYCNYVYTEIEIKKTCKTNL